jgi:hypothetical protein
MVVSLAAFDALPEATADTVLYGGLGGHNVASGPQASKNDGALVIVSETDGSTTLVGHPAVVSPSRATPPVIVPAPISDHSDSTCGFPLQVHFTANAETAKIFSDGTIIVTGPPASRSRISSNGGTRTVYAGGPKPTVPHRLSRVSKSVDPRRVVRRAQSQFGGLDGGAGSA